MLSLEIADADGHWLEEASTVLDEELLDYLAALPGLAALHDLRRLAMAGETLLDEAARTALQADLEAIAPLVRGRQLPEPPAWVGLEGTGDIRLGEELGWPGLVDVLNRLARLLALARKPGMGMWAVGE
jgi:hypothetical protein